MDKNYINKYYNQVTAEQYKEDVECMLAEQFAGDDNLLYRTASCCKLGALYPEVTTGKDIVKYYIEKPEGPEEGDEHLETFMVRPNLVEDKDGRIYALDIQPGWEAVYTDITEEDNECVWWREV